MLADAKRGKKRSSNCKIAGVSKTRSRDGAGSGSIFFKKECCFKVRVRVNTNPNP